VAIVEAANISDAARVAWDLGINPGGEVMGQVLEDAPEGFWLPYAGRLLTGAEGQTRCQPAPWPLAA
jgi:hypothetical protein